jgi:16S rRNA (guanine527-N7)-methyltransferase
MPALYRHWNVRVNVISRKDIENLEVHHILHSLSIARIFSFIPGTRILDAGTGGGFPGLPLAIVFPEVSFTLADSIAKKIRVVETISGELGLKNVKAVTGRVENINGKFDFVTGRAVTALPGLVKLVQGKINPNNRNDKPNGMIYLKGGDFGDELDLPDSQYSIYDLADYFTESYFETKKLVHIWRNNSLPSRGKFIT